MGGEGRRAEGGGRSHGILKVMDGVFSPSLSGWNIESKLQCARPPRPLPPSLGGTIEGQCSLSPTRWFIGSAAWALNMQPHPASPPITFANLFFLFWLSVTRTKVEIKRLHSAQCPYRSLDQCRFISKCLLYFQCRRNNKLYSMESGTVWYVAYPRRGNYWVEERQYSSILISAHISACFPSNVILFVCFSAAWARAGMPRATVPPLLRDPS